MHEGLVGKRSQKDMGDCLYCGDTVGFESVWSKWLKQYPSACEACYASFSSISHRVCKKCGRPHDERWFVGEEICQDCTKLWCNEDLFLGNRSLFSYDQAGQVWMKRFKFQGDAVLAWMFEKGIQKACAVYKRQIDAVVPIPLSESIQKERRFNQAEIIAEMVSPKKIKYLFLKEEQFKQSKLDRNERLHRANPFLLNKEAWQGFSGQTILLVDDVYTTGTTIYQAAQKIWEKSPCKIYSFTLFR